MNIIPPKRIQKQDKSGDNPYWMSFSDLMAGLLVIFMLACCALCLQLLNVKAQQKKVTVELEELKDQVEKDIDNIQIANKVRKNLIVDIAKELKFYDIEVEINENDSVIRIPENELYFESNSYSIQEKHIKNVRVIGYVLAKKLNSKKVIEHIDTVFIEGHTDSRKARFRQGNWGLSAARAIEVWRFWTESTNYGYVLTKLRNKSGYPLFSVSGYAASRKVIDTEVTDDDHRANRRIDIRFTIRQPKIEEYQGVLNKL